MKTKIKCDICGKFISYKDLESKDITCRLTPDSALSEEQLVWVHNKCY